MIIRRKPTKTISGVTPLAVVISPRKCPHGTCSYCPSLNVPQSYTPESPAILRAAQLGYDPAAQVKSRLEAFKAMGHPTDKIELIVMGGTFLSYPLKYQYDFIRRCYDALNGKTAQNLDEAKKLNESAKHRCVALCIETRPDVCGEKEIKRMLEFGATRCELGVQALDDKIYRKVKRGHTIKDVVNATKLLKDAGFKIGMHVMPGLPGSNLKKDFQLFRKIFSDSRFKPDQLKIYPTQVLRGSELEKLHKKGRYAPYSEQELVELLLKMKLCIPRYCRIMRVMREIPPQWLVAGTKRIDLRKVLDEKMKKNNKKCKCIRCREIGFALREGKEVDNKLTLKSFSYLASNYKEIFLEFVNDSDIIFGLCRLRKVGKTLFVRELHVYGPQAKLKEAGRERKGKIQHKGLGTALMEKAEKIAKKEKCSEIKVISGVGVREYYRKQFGYCLKGFYMTKKI